MPCQCPLMKISASWPFISTGFVMCVFDLVRHRRMSGHEGTEKPWHPVGWAQNHILSNPLHRSRRDLANCWADPQFNTVRKINPLHVRRRRPLLRQSRRPIARQVTINMLYSERPARCGRYAASRRAFVGCSKRSEAHGELINPAQHRTNTRSSFNLQPAYQG